MFKELVRAFEIAAFPLDFFDFSLALGVFGLLLLELTDIVLQFVLLETSPLDLVDLLLLFTDLVLQARHVLLLPLQGILS